VLAKLASFLLNDAPSSFGISIFPDVSKDLSASQHKHTTQVIAVLSQF
jgi:hypothetical protein